MGKVRVFIRGRVSGEDENKCFFGGNLGKNGKIDKKNGIFGKNLSGNKQNNGVLGEKVSRKDEK